MKPYFHLRIAWLLVFFGLGYLLVEAFWKLRFIGGWYGLYWLFVIADRSFLPLTVGAFLGALVALVSVFATSVHAERLRRLWLAGAFLFMGLCVVVTITALFAWNTVHLDSYQARGRTYHLAAYPLFDVDFGIYQCDSFGLICRTLYLSGDYVDPEAMTAHFSYDETAQTISAAFEGSTGERTLIFQHLLSE